MPTHPKVSFLKTSTLPVHLINSLAEYGIVTTIQLFEKQSTQAKQLETITGVNSDKLKKLLKKHLGTPPELSSLTCGQFALPPLTGLMEYQHDSPILMQRWQAMASERHRLSAAVQRLVKEYELPLKMDLTPHLPPVGNQGPWGTCVGWGSTAAREFPVAPQLSPGWAYRGAKQLDGHPDVEGSWLNFAFEFFYKYGHIPEDIYSYQDAIQQKPMEPFYKKAATYKIDGFIDLMLDDEDMHLMPLLLKALLSGVLFPEMGPHPVAIGVAVYESVSSASTYRTGLWTLPLPGEKPAGGHAMTIVGYIDATHPDTPFDDTYFLVRNSWGEQWAAGNPFGYPGHALIPARYFADRKYFWNGIFSIAEVSPMKSDGLLGTLWRKTKWIIH